MQLVAALANKLSSDAYLRDVPVRVFNDDSEEHEQILIRTSQSYPVEGQAPLYNAHYSVQVRALTHERAEWICHRAFKVLQGFLPDDTNEYVHSQPVPFINLGYIADDDQKRPTYGFTALYIVTPRQLI